MNFHQLVLEQYAQSPWIDQFPVFQIPKKNHGSFNHQARLELGQGHPLRLRGHDAQPDGDDGALRQDERNSFRNLLKLKMDPAILQALFKVMDPAFLGIKQ